MGKPSRNISRMIKAVLFVALLGIVATAGYFVTDSLKKTNVSLDSAVNLQSDLQGIENKATTQTPADTVAATQGDDGIRSSSSSALFTVSSVKLGEPDYTYKKDKLGYEVKACGVDAQVTVNAAGSVKYYWQTYHPQYFNPSSNGPESSIDFSGPGTKTIVLDTYISEDNRRFTLFITSPSTQSFSTSEQVWCP